MISSGPLTPPCHVVLLGVQDIPQVGPVRGGGGSVFYPDAERNDHLAEGN
jgi:hypothetical protein